MSGGVVTHGTRSCYQRGCRQAECREANRQYLRNYRADGGTVRYTVEPRNHLARFFNMTRPYGGCLIWTGDTSNGYGKFSVEDRTCRAHRWLYEQLMGALPADITLDHLCRQRACVRLSHLEPVTHAENCRRGADARRQERESA